MNRDGVTIRYTLVSMYLCTYERMNILSAVVNNDISSYVFMHARKNEPDEVANCDCNFIYVFMYVRKNKRPCFRESSFLCVAIALGERHLTRSQNGNLLNAVSTKCVQNWTDLFYENSNRMNEIERFTAISI